MLRGAEAGDFQVLYLFSLSRLARESVITMPILKRLVYVYKVRVISVTEGIDTDRDNWEMIASVMSLLHERYVKELAENVFRGQEGAVLAGLCVGDYRFGYTSEPIPGSEATRRGRHAKPRMTYVIDDMTAPWVVRIFHWFVKEQQSLRRITRELNRRGAPKDHRSTTEHWHHQQVADLLASPKYVGFWAWGESKNTRDPETGKIRQDPRSDEECEKWTRQFPHLRIIDDETFEKAQQLLQENYEKHVASRRSNGTLHWKQRGSADCPPRHLLSGLIKCAECGSTFHVGGAHGKYLFCPRYQKGICSCKTTLQRDRAQRMILSEIGRRILADPVWFRAVYDQTLKSWQRHEQQVPKELVSAGRALADTEQKLTRLVDSIENGHDDPDVKRRLDERRAERRDLSETIKRLKQASEHCGPPPDEDWVRERLEQLGATLNGDTPAAAYALRGLVGGSIVVTEIREDDRKRFYLQGRFTLCTNLLADAVASQCTGGEDNESGTANVTEDIMIDFVDPNPLDAESERAKELYDEGLMNVEIHEQLGYSKSKVTKLLKHWFESRGQQKPDGRSRRSKLKRKHSEPPLYQRISNEVKRLCDGPWLLGEIAAQLNCDPNTVTKALAFWHESRGLEVPDGRTRRKTLDRKVPKPRTEAEDEDDTEDTASAA
jgi:transposase